MTSEVTPRFLRPHNQPAAWVELLEEYPPLENVLKELRSISPFTTVRDIAHAFVDTWPDITSTKRILRVRTILNKRVLPIGMLDKHRYTIAPTGIDKEPMLTSGADRLNRHDLEQLADKIVHRFYDTTDPRSVTFSEANQRLQPRPLNLYSHLLCLPGTEEDQLIDEDEINNVFVGHNDIARVKHYFASTFNICESRSSELPPGCTICEDLNRSLSAYLNLARVYRPLARHQHESFLWFPLQPRWTVSSQRHPFNRSDTRRNNSLLGEYRRYKRR